MAKKSPPDKMISLSGMRGSIESLRTSLIDIEALAHSAEASLQEVPYLPRLPQSLDTDGPMRWTREERRSLGRVQALVCATAQAAEEALSEFEDLIRELAEEEGGGDDGPDDNGDDGAENGEKPLDGTLPPITTTDAAITGTIPEPIEEQVTLPRISIRSGIVLDTQPLQPTLG